MWVLRFWYIHKLTSRALRCLGCLGATVAEKNSKRSSSSQILRNRVRDRVAVQSQSETQAVVLSLESLDPMALWYDALTAGRSLRAAGCTLVYLDVGSNRGDTLEDFAHGKRVTCVANLLQLATRHWLPRSSCVFGFEPNPIWTRRLIRMRLSQDLHAKTMRKHALIRRRGGNFRVITLNIWLINSKRSG